MKAALVVLFLVGCATPSTVEGRRERIRDAIHWRHTQCQHAAETLSRDVDAMRFFRCDSQEQAACVAAGLERQCGEWQSGGM